jgi:hypothetical protein
LLLRKVSRNERRRWLCTHDPVTERKWKSKTPEMIMKAMNEVLCRSTLTR